MNRHDVEHAGTTRGLRQRLEDASPRPHQLSAWISAELLSRRNSPSPPTTPRHHEEKGSEQFPEPRVSWKQRIRHFTWSWFTLSMATGGISNALHRVPFQFSGLYAIGCVFLILNIVLFLMNCTLMSLRFYYWPSAFKAAFLHPTESLFVPALVISIATILSNICEYGIVGTGSATWLVTACVIMFWAYIGLAFIFSVGIYLLMWSTQTFTISQMTPVWIFPAYPLLLVGPIAGVLSTPGAGASGDRALDIIVGGVIVQGVGFTVSLMIYSAFIYRLMTQKLPAEGVRPGMFVSVGPAGFTVSGLINMGHNFPRVVPADFMGNGHVAGLVAKMLAYWSGMWIWGLCVFFFLVSIGAHWSCVSHGRLNFAMTWWAFVFPNSALVTATFAVAKALNSNFALNVVGCIMTCALVAAWAFIFTMNIRAVILKQVLWPQKGEDKDADLERRRRRVKVWNSRWWNHPDHDDIEGNERRDGQATTDVKARGSHDAVSGSEL